MKKRRLALSALTFASCSPIATVSDAGIDAGPDAGTSTPDAGTDAGYDAGAPDAGAPDAGRDAGPGPSTDGGLDAGCACYRADGGCPIPPDFPADASTFFMQELCYCEPTTNFFCYDETDLRCPSWSCFPGKQADGGAQYQPDGGLECLC